MKQQRAIILAAIVFSLIFTGVYYALFSSSMSSSSLLHKTLYMNQVGLYKQEDTLQEMKDKLSKEGIDSYTWQQGDTTAVVCYVSTNVEDTKNGQEKLKTLGINYIQKTAEIDSNEVSSLIDEKKYQEVLERIAQ